MGFPPAAAPAPAPPFLAPAAATSVAFLLGVVEPPMALAIWLESKLGKLRTLPAKQKQTKNEVGGGGEGYTGVANDEKAGHWSQRQGETSARLWHGS